MFSRKAGLEHAPQTQGHVSIFGGVFGGLVDGHAGEADEGLATSRHIAEGDGLVAEMQFGELVHAMAVAPGVQHIGHEHGVIERRHFHAMLAEHRPVEFGVLGDL